MTKVSEKLNQFLANSLVLFAKLHNYHWNVKGVEFYVIHKKTEELYKFIESLYDDFAERILQIGGTPIVTLKQALEMATIVEEKKTSFDAKYVVKNIVKDFEFLVKELKILADLAKEDIVTNLYVDEKAAFLEKEIWTLKSFAA
ncbi:putative DNA protection during starvation protein 2 [Candidatus Phycorickettsia trachydisci]|uniref:Putative DNA protection during starvation protein 2 n=1 Tax=Candidatus Phycorickettsia trachydisci TaxID=2115978 RepID=A0A2P1P850_9RICK|nr:DNA starvation/stationary phase protection protein [Candidatus Phycorickettsia trachydisci]AVP87434.1 putative DNA protection during starvation protein 2 [Candidatus Phycorickettsia trachydisci]